MSVSSTRTALSGANFHNILDNKPTIRVSTPTCQGQPANMRRGLESLIQGLSTATPLPRGHFSGAVSISTAGSSSAEFREKNVL